MSGARHRRKGNRVERELVQLHKALGVHADGLDIPDYLKRDAKAGAA
jgi:hypothetical protein